MISKVNYFSIISNNKSSYIKKESDRRRTNGYKKIAVYCMSYAGETLIDELSGSNVDAIVVIITTFVDVIEEMLLNKVDCPIVFGEDILYELI